MSSLYIEKGMISEFASYTLNADDTTLEVATSIFIPVDDRYDIVYRVNMVGEISLISKEHEGAY